MPDLLQRSPEWLKYLILFIGTSAAWIAVGELTGSAHSDSKRLDRIEALVQTSQEVVSVNVRQTVQIEAMDRRIVELEHGRDTNRDAIATINAKIAAFEGAISQQAAALRDLQADLRRHAVETDKTLSGLAKER